MYINVTNIDDDLDPVRIYLILDYSLDNWQLI